MSTTTPAAPTDTAVEPRIVRGRSGSADRAFQLLTRSSGAVVLGIMLLVGLFLGVRAVDALKVAGWGFFTEQRWDPDAAAFGIRAVMVGTLLVGLVAVFVALPLAVGTALYISEYAPQRIRNFLVSAVDLMAAVPSVVYGLWGFVFLQEYWAAIARWLSTYLAWIPLLRVDGVDPHDPLANVTQYKSSTAIAGIVVGLMVTPIMCSLMREVFSQAPVGEREGAYALGASRWAMIRAVVLPYGRGGIVGGTMLGLGRALGETIAVYLIISLVIAVQPHILESGGSSISALIASKYAEATQLGTSALMAAGLSLFVLTLVINFGASLIVARSRSGAQDA